MGSATADVSAKTRSVGASDVSAETPPGHAALEDADGLRVSAETARRMACDAGAVVMQHAADGAVLDVGRKTRTIPPVLWSPREAASATPTGAPSPAEQ